MEIIFTSPEASMFYLNGSKICFLRNFLPWMEVKTNASLENSMEVYIVEGKIMYQDGQVIADIFDKHSAQRTQAS